MLASETKCEKFLQKTNLHPQMQQNKRYHAHFRTREFKNDIFGCYPKSNKKDPFLEV
jgi:hypothetical protein